MKKILFLLSALIVSIAIQAQTFEEFKKQRADEMAAMKQKQEEFINRMQNEFNDYVKQRDQEFADYLKKQWEQFNVMKGIAPPEKPKPAETPEYKPEPAREGQWLKMPVIKPPVNVKKEMQKEVKVPLIQKADEASYDKSNMTFGFFGFRLILDYDQQVKLDPPAVINPSTISGFWEKMSRTNYTDLVNQMQQYKTDMNLNDYGYYLMLQQFAKTIYPGSETGEDLLVWNLLTRSGYKTRIAYSNNKLSLLIPSQYTLYSKNFMKTEGLNYYLMRDIGNNIFTYDKDYPDASKLIDFSIGSPLNLTKNIKQKSFTFDYKSKPYTFDFYVNQNLIDFYKDYPQSDLNIYFDAPVSSETKESIVDNFKPVIEGMSESEAVSFLLKFVQTSFKYETDQQQFAKEKFFFPEEIFFYPYSDCEDRSILFSYLVKTLLNNKVIGIEYPGHVATAVNFNSAVEGDFVMYNGDKYIIADATFENAPLGMAMPEYRNVEGKIIEIDQYMNRGAENKSFWELARKAGGNRGDNLSDIVFDEAGYAYLTGYFTGSATFGNVSLTGSADQRNVFVAKYDKNGNVVWAKKASGTDHASGFSILNDAAGDIYISGSFGGKIEFENGIASLQCMEGLTDVFIAKYTGSGQFKWASKIGLDTYPQENYLTYLTKCTKDGVNKGTVFYNENEGFSNYGLQLGPMGLLYLTGTFQKSTGAVVGSLALNTNEIKEFNLIESLKAESDKLVADRYEKSIAGVFSVMNHMKLSGVKISGNDVRIALDKYNPGFKKLYPEIYNNLGKINIMLNSDGIVKLETLDGSSVIFDKLKISSGATLKISSLQSGDAQLDVLSGISVGKMVIWFDLNYVKLYKINGNLLFDYDSDHTQKMMNLKADILE
jgi:hypothetical protein